MDQGHGRVCPVEAMSQRKGPKRWTSKAYVHNRLFRQVNGGAYAMPSLFFNKCNSSSVSGRDSILVRVTITPLARPRRPAAKGKR